MKVLKFLLFFIIFLFLSCSEDENVLNKEEGQLNAPTSYYVSAETALTNATAMLNKIEKASSKATRTSEKSSREVEGIEVLHSNLQIRSQASNASINSDLYLVNYANNKGFALLSSDSRLRPIYAISDTGHIQMADTINNKALSMFFKNVYADIAYASSNPSAYEYDGKKFISDAQVSPKLWQNVRLWSQKYPYNKYCPFLKKDSTVVGCTALSIAQVMSYYSWPTKVGSLSIPWRSIKMGRNVDAIAKLLARLGKSDLLDIHYGKTASGADSANYQRTFLAMRYENPGNFKVFTETSVRDALSSGPILVIGSNIFGTSGHSWVMDGYATNVENVSDKSTLYHCVWGWGGKSNGYFYWIYNILASNVVGLDINDNYNGYQAAKHELMDLHFMSNFKKVLK